MKIYYNNNSIEGQAEVEINSYHAENLINNRTSGSAFILSEYAKLTVRLVIFYLVINRNNKKLKIIIY